MRDPVPSADHQPGSFAATTAVEPLGGGRYRAAIEAGWFGPPGPNGGFIAALVLRGIRAEVADPGRLPRSLTVHYLRPPAAGPAEIEVAVERAGRTATSCSARIVQEGRPVTLALCVLSGQYEGIAEWAPEMPAAPSPEEIEPIPLGEGAPPLFEQLEIRPAFGPEPFSGGAEAEAGGWIRTRAETALEPELIALYTDAWWPAPFGVLQQPSPAPTLDLTIHFRARPEPQARDVLTRFRAEASIDGLFDEQGEVWSRDGRLLAQSRQLALLRPWRA